MISVAQAVELTAVSMNVAGYPMILYAKPPLLSICEYQAISVKSR